MLHNNCTIMRHLKINQIINNKLNIAEIYLEDESHNHSGKKVETHFKLFLVSDDFKGLNRVSRQRLINDLLKSEFEDGLHALTMRLLTPEERVTQGPEDFISPACRGSKKL